MISLCKTVLFTLFAVYASAADQEHCSKPADIVFLLDDSRSIWYLHFNDELNFVKTLVGEFDISDTATRIAAATFSSGVREEFAFGQYNTVSEVQSALDQITQSNGGTTDTFTAIKFARETLFKSARPGVPRILIIVTDGVSSNRAETLRQATDTINSGIRIIVVGVGTMDTTQLAEMASQPLSDYLFTVSSFPDLSAIESLVAQQACKASSDTPNDQPAAEKECLSKPAEVAFVLDKSNSVYIFDFQKQLAFVNDVIDIFDIGSDKTRVAGVSFSTNASVEYHLDEFDNKQDIKDRTAKIIYTGGITETRLALIKVRDEVFTAAHGFRPNVAHIVIVVTDGRSQEYLETREVAKSLKNNGVHMFAIGVGNDVDPQELRDIGSTPSDDYVFEVDGYAALTTIKNIIAYRACSQSP